MKRGKEVVMSSKEWISVKEQLPSYEASGFSKQVLVVGFIDMKVKRYDFELKRWTGSPHEIVNFWQPLPEPTKPKELKDLRSGEYCYVIKQSGRLIFGERLKVHSLNDDGFDAYTDGVYLKTFNFDDTDIISPYSPTPAQIEAAEEAAINEVKAKFDRIKKEAANEI
jgi:hypothetical protein